MSRKKTRDVTRFIILSHGRTGSTALCNGLSMHPRIHAYHETFHGEFPMRCAVNGKVFENGTDGGAFCREIIHAEQNEFGKPVIGFKLFFFHAREGEAEYNVWRHLMADTSVRVIFLLRRNLFDSFVSEQRSKQSGVWSLDPGQKPPETHTQPIFIDPIECQIFMERTAAEIAWARRAFARHTQITMDHADLQRDFQGSLDALCQFLGEEPAPVPLTFEKLNTAPHPSGVMNYDDLLRYFQCSIFRECFIPENGTNGTHRPEAD